MLFFYIHYTISFGYNKFWVHLPKTLYYEPFYKEVAVYLLLLLLIILSLILLSLLLLLLLLLLSLLLLLLLLLLSSLASLLLLLLLLLLFRHRPLSSGWFIRTYSRPCSRFPHSRTGVSVTL